VFHAPSSLKPRASARQESVGARPPTFRGVAATIGVHGCLRSKHAAVLSGPAEPACVKSVTLTRQA
jgi:hypothetical protein